MKRNNKAKKSKNNGSNKINNALRMGRSLQGVPVTKVVQFNDTIRTTSGSTGPAWSNGLIYVNLLQKIHNSADYTELNDAYQRAHLLSMRLLVVRKFTETSNTSIISSGIPLLRIGFYPALSGSSVSNTVVINTESAMVLDPHEVKPITHVYPFPNVQLSDGTYFFNPGLPFDANAALSSIQACVLAVGWVNSANASSTTDIYDVQFQILMKFDIPY